MADKLQLAKLLGLVGPAGAGTDWLACLVRAAGGGVVVGAFDPDPDVRKTAAGRLLAAGSPCEWFDPTGPPQASWLQLLAEAVDCYPTVAVEADFDAVDRCGWNPRLFDCFPDGPAPVLVVRRNPIWAFAEARWGGLPRAGKSPIKVEPEEILAAVRAYAVLTRRLAGWRPHVAFDWREAWEATRGPCLARLKFQWAAGMAVPGGAVECGRQPLDGDIHRWITGVAAARAAAGRELHRYFDDPEAT